MSVPTAAVLLAAGSGSRVGAGRNKVLLTLQGASLLVHAARTLRAVSGIRRLVVVARAGEEDDVAALLADESAYDVAVVTGGATRHASEWTALSTLAGDIDAGTFDVVAIHDSARPLAQPQLWQGVIQAAAEHGGAIPARPQPGLIARRDPATGVLDLAGVQTPQAFAAGPLLAAYRSADRDGFEGTDTASCVARYVDLRIAAVSAPATNLKVTYPEDVRVAERLLGR